MATTRTRKTSQQIAAAALARSTVVSPAVVNRVRPEDRLIVDSEDVMHYNAPYAYTGKHPKLHAVISDIHFPYNEPVVTDGFIQFCRDYQPSWIHVLGDAADFYAASRFSTNPQRINTMQDELDLVKEYLSKLRDACPGSAIVYTEGNHEARLRRYLWDNAKALASLRCLELRELLGLRENFVSWRGARKPYKIGNLTHIHGIYVRKHSAMSAKAHFERFGSSLIVGHTHRQGSYSHTIANNTFACWENGCACSMVEQEYLCAPPDWQQGWSVVTQLGDRFGMTQVFFKYGQWIYDEQLWGKRSPMQGDVFIPDLMESGICPVAA